MNCAVLQWYIKYFIYHWRTAQFTIFSSILWFNLNFLHFRFGFFHAFFKIGVEIIDNLDPFGIYVEFTAKMERDLDHVEEGNTEWVKIIDNFYTDFEKRVKKAESEMKEVEIEPEYAGDFFTRFSKSV